MSSPRETSYDQVEYVARPYLSTHPDRLSTIGRLYGLKPADPRRARVLELGCSDGGNLVSMATTLPESSFWGIDAAGSSIESGRELIGAIGLPNVDLKWADLLALEDELGQFDYIVAHGVYSWVPDTVRRKILAIIKASLAPQGIAFISYNTYPGYFPRRMARELMLFHVRGIDDPEERITEALNHLSTIAGAQPEGSTFRGALEHELKQLAKAGTSFVFHDALSAENTAFYFEEFMTRASEFELQFLSESQFFESFEAAALIGIAQPVPVQDPPDIVRSEQYLDQWKNRVFRQTLLVHGGLSIDRSLDPGRLEGMFVLARFQREASDETAAESQIEQFVGIGGARVTTNSPIAKAAFTVLTQAWPGAIAFADLLERTLALAKVSASVAECRRELGSLLIRCYASRMLELRSTPPGFTLEPGDRPLASPLSRRQAATDELIVNLRHGLVRIEHPLPRALLCLLDGQRTRSELLSALGGFAAEKSLAAPSEADLDGMLRELAGHGLLMAR